MIILFLGFFLQISFLGTFRIFGVLPDLVLILILLFAVHDKNGRVVPLSIFFGFLMDIVTNATFGFYMILFLVLVAITKAITKDSTGTIPTPVILTIFAIGFILHVFFQAILFYVQNGVLSLGLVEVYLSQIVLDLGVGMILYFVLRRFFEYLVKLDDKSKMRVA